jgi:hypothetical protein
MARAKVRATTRRNQRRLARVSPSEARRALSQIVTALDGHEWSPDTLDEIARVLINAGFTIGDPVSDPAETSA